MSNVFVKRVSPAPDLQPNNSLNKLFWQTIEGLSDDIVSPSFFVVKVMSKDDGKLIRDAIKGDKVLYFDKHGNIFVRPGTKDDTDFGELCPEMKGCVLINNPLTKDQMSGGEITQRFLKQSVVKNTITSFKDPSTKIGSDYTRGNTFTNKKIVMAPSLKWIIYTDDKNVVKLLYNPIHSKEWKKEWKNTDNLKENEGILKDYCTALQTTRPDGTSKIVMDYFSDPTCNGYFSDRTCINSGEEFNLFDSLKGSVRNEFIGPTCICKSPSFWYDAQAQYNKDETFLQELFNIKTGGRDKCPVRAITVQNIDCKTILNSAGDIDISDTELVNDCKIQETPPGGEGGGGEGGGGKGGGDPPSPPPAKLCKSCSNNGKCEDGKCVCNPGFSGSDCDKIALSTKISDFVIVNGLVIGVSVGIIALIIIMILILTR